MRILLVSDYATPTGGAELLTLALRDQLRQRGHDARFFASCAGREETKSLADYECFGTTSRWRTLLQTANPWAAAKLNRVLAEFQPDVVHVVMFLTQLSPLILPHLQNVPCIYSVQWYRPICPLGTKMLPNGTICPVPAGTVCYRSGCLPLRDWGPLMLQMKMWRSRRSVFDCIVANSEAVKRRLVAEGIEPVEVIRNGVAVRSPRPPLEETPTVAFAGRLVREKGVDVLLRAFASIVEQVPEARLFIAGEGPERRNLEQLIVQLRLSSHVEMLGALSQDEMEHRFESAWVQAVPSRWAEPFGLVAAEAMMRGTAVIAGNCGGLAEIVRHGETGFLVAPNDVAALAQAMLRLLQNRALCEEMGRAGRAAALTHFSEAAYADSFVRLYEKLMDVEKDHFN